MKSEKTKTYSTNKIIYPILFIAYSIILEMANFLYFGFESSSGARLIFPTYFLFDLAIIFMLAGLIFIVQHKVAIQFLFHFFIIIQVAMYIVNTTMYGIFGDVLSFDLLKLGAEATTAFTFDLIDWGGLLMNLALYIVIIISCVLLNKLNKTTYTIKYFSTPVILLAFFIFIQSFGVCLFESQTMSLKTSSAQQTEIEGSDKYLWDNFQFKIDAYKKFGFFGFYIKGTVNLLFPTKVDTDTKKDYINFIDEGYTQSNPNAPLYNDNLIVILCESLDNFAIDPYLTPTLWKLKNGYNSIYLDNFYARNRTNISEGLTLLGSMPKNATIKEAYNKGYKFDYSLPNLFEKTGNANVKTSYFHCNSISFYDRNITFKDDAIGFNTLYGQEAYTGEQNCDRWGQWITDVDFTANLMDKMLPTTGERFLTYFASMSNHGPWVEEKKNFKEYYQEFDALVDSHKEWFINNSGYIWPEGEDYNIYRNYKTGTMDFDRTVAQLLQELENRGLSENTSVVLFADHNAYYQDLGLVMRGLNKTQIYEIDAYEIPVIIYSPAYLKSLGYVENEEGYVQGFTYQNFCNTHDIFPTICDLYGLPYNKNLCQGYSIFSEEIQDSFFASHLGGMFTNKLFSQNITEIYIADKTANEEDIHRFRKTANKYYEKQAILEAIYSNGINGTI